MLTSFSCAKGKAVSQEACQRTQSCTGLTTKRTLLAALVGLFEHSLWFTTKPASPHSAPLSARG